MSLIHFKDFKHSPDIVHQYNSALKAHSTPIIIDNGSYQCRVGWASSSEPLLMFKNIIAKPRKERYKKDDNSSPMVQVGNDIVNIEAVRFQLKSQFDKNVVTHFEAQEHAFDYIFSHLGININNIPHPIVLTEPMFNPNLSRQLMSELLFECYQVPSVSYGIDCLFAHHYSENQDNALLISLGYHTCHVVPIVGGKCIYNNVRRLNIGGFHIITFLHKILQLKYPAHTNAITIGRIEELLHDICEVALDYREELRHWLDSDYYDKNIKKIQLPYSNLIASTLSIEQQKERRKELAKRLTEINARKREERLAEDEEKLSNLLRIQEMFEVGIDTDVIQNELAEINIKNIQDLIKNIGNLKSKIEKIRQKILSSKNDDADEPPAKNAKIAPKISFDNDKDLNSYLCNIKQMRQEILNKKLLRKQRKNDMAKRRTAAGQERMRIISQLARKEKGNDDFGLRDEDWDIYKTISKDGNDTDSDVENEKLMELEDIIKEYEPNDIDEVINLGETYQLHVGIERFRAPELLFKPYMIGCSDGGLIDIITFVLSLFDEKDQLALASNVVLIGSLSNIPGIDKRILTDLVSVRPFKSDVNVKICKNPNLAAWYGAKKWVKHPDFKKRLLTKHMYFEYGSEYFQSHKFSNPYFPTPGDHVVVDM